MHPSTSRAAAPCGPRAACVPERPAAPGAEASRPSHSGAAILGGDARRRCVSPTDRGSGLPRTLDVEGFPGLRQVGGRRLGAQGQAEVTRPARGPSAPGLQPCPSWCQGPSSWRHSWSYRTQ